MTRQLFHAAAIGAVYVGEAIIPEDGELRPEFEGLLGHVEASAGLQGQNSQTRAYRLGIRGEMERLFPAARFQLLEAGLEGYRSLSAKGKNKEDPWSHFQILAKRAIGDQSLDI